MCKTNFVQESGNGFFWQVWQSAWDSGRVLVIARLMLSTLPAPEE